MNPTEKYQRPFLPFWKSRAALIIAYSIVGVLVILLTAGCVPTAAKQKLVAPEAAPLKVSEGRIDAGQVIQEANDSGCDMTKVTYEEGKRKSTIVIECHNLVASD